MDNRIDGVVITFSDITAAKKVEAGLRARHGDLTTHSAEQGVALDRALKRLQTRDGRGKTKGKLVPKAAGSAGRSPR